ncbi:MAG TPA: bifunctional 5,10-methylenetetrahydrofolate dehydrogenase/5,10-methenyltetrahydrofolate cyclohydrolase [Acholeplasmataceae bacterium]|nr:bifunctional 5,10-methylenetetrahydrofolate dehydrogenase/5,10-methenyltetrahydrofolate cyclohydrolase [Acholeplasmataceae bacterium]
MILDGKLVANIRNEKLKEQITKDLAKGISSPNIKIINVGDDPASKSYIKSKRKAARDVLINAEIIEFNEDVSQKEIENLIIKLNQDSSVDGILLQLPLPKHLNEHYLTNLIEASKDIDGFTLINQGKLFQKQKALRPATPQGILNLLEYYEIDVSGLNVVVVGRSQIVGLPIAKMLLDLNATVTICHSRTKDLINHTKSADLIIMAVGIPLMLKADMVKEGAIIVDVGINRVDGRLYGDVDFENVAKKAKYITPVPKGVGPMTINALLENAYKIKKEK